MCRITKFPSKNTYKLRDCHLVDYKDTISTLGLIMVTFKTGVVSFFRFKRYCQLSQNDVVMQWQDFEVGFSNVDFF